MNLIKPIRNANLLIPYKQLLIQTTQKEGKLIPKKLHGEHNPFFELITDYNCRIPKNRSPTHETTETHPPTNYIIRSTTCDTQTVGNRTRRERGGIKQKSN